MTRQDRLKLALSKIQLDLDIVKDKLAIWNLLESVPSDDWTSEHDAVLKHIN